MDCWPRRSWQKSHWDGVVHNSVAVGCQKRWFPSLTETYEFWQISRFGYRSRYQAASPISEGTKVGLASARKRGRIGGRPPCLTGIQKDEVRRMRDVEGSPLREIASLFKVSVRTIQRA